MKKLFLSFFIISLSFFLFGQTSETLENSNEISTNDDFLNFFNQLENTNNSPRYKKESLTDYVPKQIISLPTEEEEIILIENPNQKDKNGQTLLMQACKTGNDWDIKNLINSGADINLQDKEGWTALMYAVRYQQNINIIDLLISKGAKVKQTNNLGFSSLILAATYNDNPLIIQKILSFYKYNEKEVFKAFILCLSSNTSTEHSYLAKVSAFLDFGVTLNSFYEGKTPLMYCAIYSKTTKVIKLLIENGAFIDVRSTENKTAFDYASENPVLVHDNIFWSLNSK